MTQTEPRPQPSMTRRMTQTAALLAIAGVLSAGALACGKYGPPQPYPPEVEEDDEDRRS